MISSAKTKLRCSNLEKEGVTVMAVFFFIMGDRLLIPPGLGIVGFSEEKDLFEIQL